MTGHNSQNLGVYSAKLWVSGWLWMAGSFFAHVSRQINPLVAVKLLHTVVWALLAGCILALPVITLMHRFNWAVVLTVIILVECGVLALNSGRCPLTDVASRFTGERADIFGIYLPNWIARHNKPIFGAILMGMRRCLNLRLANPFQRICTCETLSIAAFGPTNTLPAGYPPVTFPSMLTES